MNTYNSTAYATGNPPLSAVGDIFIIDGYGIHNDNLYVISKTDSFATDLQSYDFPVSNGKGFVSNYYRGRTIQLEMLLKADTESEFLTLLDEVRGRLARNDIYLKEKVNGEYRQIKVTTVDLPLNKEHYNITFLQFTVVFIALEPFWYDEKFTSSSFLNLTTDTQEEITNLGNVEVEPLIVYAFKTVSSTTFIRIDFNGIYIQLNETISTSDNVKIDCKNKTITLNGVLKDYDGTFPELKTGSNIINMTSDGTYEVDVNILYNKNYK